MRRRFRPPRENAIAATCHSHRDKNSGAFDQNACSISAGDANPPANTFALAIAHARAVTDAKSSRDSDPYASTDRAA